LIANGHEVLGLARSAASAAKIVATGAKVHYGSIEDLDSLKSGAAASDGVIHTAFIHDFSNFQANCEKDRQAIEAMGSVLTGSDRPLVISSGIGLLSSNLLSSNRLATEDDKPESSTPRVASEEAATALVARGARAAAMRLPPTVHGEGDHHGFVPRLIAIAREKGVSAYIGDGTNRWPAVHRLDAALAFRLALEKGAQQPQHYHAVDDEGVPTKQIAEHIGRHLNLPVVSISLEEATAHFGFLGHFFSRNVPATSKQTREWLGWRPTHSSLLADLHQGHYFKL